MMVPVSTALLALGYLLAVPFTVWVPGFRRLWRRREPLVFLAAQAGAALITVGFALQGNLLGMVLNAGWTVGLAVAYLAEGRKRGRLSRARQ